MTKRFRKAILCVAIGCAMALAFAMTGCSTDSTYEPETKTPQVQSPTIKEAGVLRVGVNTGRAPLAGMSGNKIVGVDVDVAAAIADSLGLKLSIVDTGSDPEGALKDGSVDIVLGIDKSSTDGSFWKSDSYPRASRCSPCRRTPLSRLRRPAPSSLRRFPPRALGPS